MQGILKKSSVPTAVHYPTPLNKQPAVRDLNSLVPVGDMLSDQVLSLPMHAYMTDETFNLIANTLKESLV